MSVHGESQIIFWSLSLAIWNCAMSCTCDVCEVKKNVQLKKVTVKHWTSVHYKICNYTDYTSTRWLVMVSHLTLNQPCNSLVNLVLSCHIHHFLNTLSHQGDGQVGVGGVFWVRWWSSQKGQLSLWQTLNVDFKTTCLTKSIFPYPSLKKLFYSVPLNIHRIMCAIRTYSFLDRKKKNLARHS